MTTGDIVRVNRPGEHAGRYGVVREVKESDLCVVEFEDDHKQEDFQASEIDFVRRGPFRTNPR